MNNRSNPLRKKLFDPCCTEYERRMTYCSSLLKKENFSRFYSKQTVRAISIKDALRQAIDHLKKYLNTQ